MKMRKRNCSFIGDLHLCKAPRGGLEQLEMVLNVAYVRESRARSKQSIIPLALAHSLMSLPFLAEFSLRL